MHWVSRIEKYLEGHEGYAVGAQLSLADLYLQQLITYSLADADQDLMMSRYPRIAMIVQNVNDILSTAGFDEKFPLVRGSSKTCLIIKIEKTQREYKLECSHIYLL
jgi:glutathione S-transferase